MTISDKVCPNLVGVDIGCGMLAVRVAEKEVDLPKPDDVINVCEEFQTIHNYIDTKNLILRKGSVSARDGEKLIIPINMRDGSLICVGKGNPDWNYSAPHGAGRLLSRSEAKDAVGIDEFREAMEGIYSSSVLESTIDESPMVYKPMNEIMENIKDTVDIVKVIKPIYNFNIKQARILPPLQVVR